jgi:uncharacterized membrane protein
VALSQPQGTEIMSTQHLVLAAVAAALALGAAPAAQAQAKEKCYGIAKAGQNDCANLSGTHSCAGQSTNENAPEEWKYVPQGSVQGHEGAVGRRGQGQDEEVSEAVN